VFFPRTYVPTQEAVVTATPTTDLRELKTALQEHIDTMEGIERDFRIEGKNVEVTADQAANYRHSLSEAEKIRSTIEMVEGGRELKAWADAPAGSSVAAQIAAGMTEAFDARELKSLGELFLESPEFKALDHGRNGLNMPTPFSLETLDFAGHNEMKDVFTANVGAGPITKFGRTQRDAVIPRAQRTARVRDLFPVAQTDSNLIEYFRVIGFGADRLDTSSGARSVRERAAADGTSAPTGGATDVFGLKPKSNLKFESAQAPVRTIAHYEVAHRNVLADEPQLQSTINNELLYGLRLEEDKQILDGDGTGENLLGILRTPNIQAYTQANTAGAPDETKADALRRAATKAVLAYYPPSGYVLHPYDWEDIELTKATGDGHYVMATNVAVGAETRAWRQQVVESPAMPEGTFLTGAWGLGAQLYDRAQANIRIADQHADFFIRNAIAILAEMRLALAVKRPESFVKGTFIG
jgi:HK97 family phage major capsid protein